MAVWANVRAAVIGGAAVAVAWAACALAAPAQGQLNFTPLEGQPAQPPELLPPLVFGSADDSAVIPAQFTRPAVGQPTRTAGIATAVADPPYPVVTVRVRVPADAAPGDDLKYTITVQNASQADAHAVTVRNPIPPEVERVVKCEPEPQGGLQANATQLGWNFGTLKAGEKKTIELTLRPKAGATTVKNLAYVKYEHGQAVTTKIGAPTIKVTKAAPKQTVRDEQYTVRVAVENTGKVPAENVRVVENVPQSAQVEPVTKGAKRLPQAEGQQWEWVLPRLLPGERKVLEYRVTAREAKDVVHLTSISGQKLIADKPSEARTAVLVPGIDLKLTGPTGVVNAGETARYEIVVRNTGTLPMSAVKVTATLPPEVKLTMKTDGGQVGRDGAIVWTVPKLEAGEAQSFRFGAKAGTTGRRSFGATATDARGQRAAQELASVFAGTAALVWETSFNPLTVPVGKQGVFTVRVKNNGGEAARNVRVQVDVPDAVSVVQTTPQVRVEGGKVLFAAETIGANAEVTYTLTFEGKKADQAWFGVRMSADSLGDRPMETQKMVEVIGGPK
jgi:uncharacterized repeat protein (TIGR01451 family)